MSKVRISCASLASIKIDNKYLILLISEHEFENWNRTDCEVAGNVKSIFNYL